MAHAPRAGAYAPYRVRPNSRARARWPVSPMRGGPSVSPNAEYVSEPTARPCRKSRYSSPAQSDNSSPPAQTSRTNRPPPSSAGRSPSSGRPHSGPGAAHRPAGPGCKSAPEWPSCARKWSRNTAARQTPACRTRQCAAPGRQNRPSARRACHSGRRCSQGSRESLCFAGTAPAPRARPRARPAQRRPPAGGCCPGGARPSPAPKSFSCCIFLSCTWAACGLWVSYRARRAASVSRDTQSAPRTAKKCFYLRAICSRF